MMLLTTLSLAALLNGCGSSSKEGSATTAELDAVAKVDEVTCAQCHGSSYNPQSGQPIYAAYAQSKHFRNSVAVVGCQDCHGGGAEHNGVGPMPYPNPDAAGKCWGCHKPAFLGTYEPNGVATTIEKAHFTNVTSFRTLYLTAADKNTCTGCHEPHNPGSGFGASERKAWAESGHGDLASAAWVPSASHKWRASGGSEDFSQAIPASDCLRCHTADGFVQFATGSKPFTSIANLAGDTKVNSPLNCTACHNNDSFSVRGVSAVSTAYNATGNDSGTKLTVAQSRIAAKFPNVGQSNICISCHSGRVSGPNLTAMFATGTWDLSKTSFVNSHYMAAAGTMYMEVGFKNFTSLNAPAASNNEGTAFTSSKTYNQTLSAINTTTPDGVVGGQNSAHRRLGTPLLAGSEGYLPANGSGISTNGPCVTCHMKAFNPVAGNGFTPPAAGRPANGHSLQIDEATAQELCLQCHADAPHLNGGDGAGKGLYTTMKNITDMQAAMIEPQKTAFQNGLTLTKQILLIKYKISYDGSSYPYFYDENLPLKNGKKQAVTDWTRKTVAGVTDAAVIALANANITVIPAGGLTQLQAYRLMGACYNLNVLARDPGAFLHARTYSQRLVYDTVDYLDNNKMDFTSLTTARALTTAAVSGLVGVYSGYDVNVLNPTPGVGLGGAGLATESMAWLAGTHYTDTKGVVAIPLKLRP
jgi:hypothetical protein